MGRSVLRDDLPGCEEAARGYPTTFVDDTTPGGWCAHAIKIVRVGKRLERARSAARAAAQVKLATNGDRVLGAMSPAGERNHLLNVCMISALSGCVPGSARV
jgi:hypothetical protein